jgi:hypothetical protein
MRIHSITHLVTTTACIHLCLCLAVFLHATLLRVCLAPTARGCIIGLGAAPSKSLLFRSPAHAFHAHKWLHLGQLQWKRINSCVMAPRRGHSKPLLYSAGCEAQPSQPSQQHLINPNKFDNSTPLNK